MASGLEVVGVHRRFGSTPVLAGVDLVVPAGTTTALLGPSGAGKSTLLRIVAGLDRPDAGEVRLGGVDVTDRPAHRRGVGVVFQDQALFPHLDVAGNVGFGLRMAGVERRARAGRVEEVLALVGLAGAEGRDPATLSGGEAQRVALARALAPEPAVLLLDEPLAALDQLLRERLLLELRGLFTRLGVTVVTVTHDPTEAATLGDRIAVLLDGAVAQEAPTPDVLARPAGARVAGLVGHRNVVRGRARPDGVHVAGWGPVPAPGSGVADGEAVTLLLRPDALALVPDVPAPDIPAPDIPVPGDAVGGRIVLGRAEVRAVLYRGGAAVAACVPAAGGDAALDVPVGPGWRVGDTGSLTVDPAGVAVLDAG